MRLNPNDPHRNQPIYERGQALGSASAAVILVHGRGSSGEDILGLAEAFDMPGLAYLAPEAAEHTWYPYSFLAPIEQNQPWLDSALGMLAKTIERARAAGLTTDRIAFVGFSQGACLATEFVARHATYYAGLVAFTGGLIGPEGTEFEYAGKLDGTPCFLGAGDPDPHVPWARVKESASVLSRLGGDVTLRRYPGLPHTINRDELEHAKNLLQRIVAKSKTLSGGEDS